ncbi:MAG: DUF4855 domain-containing protein [Bacteroidota bacterium]|nr:DUF4855 domain-containing protein [Bacteroidota bacterium]
MKRTFLILLSCIICLCACSKKSNDDPIVVKPGNNGGTTNKLTGNINGITLSVGQAQTLTSDDWDALASSKVTDFVIIPKAASTYGSTETGYKEQLAPVVIDAINQLAMRRSTAKIWIGTPGSIQSIATTSLTPISNYIKYIKGQIGDSKWKNNIRGIYMNQEAIMGTVDYNNIMTNSQIALFNDLSTFVHSILGKEFLWIPYYGYGSDPTSIIKNIAYIADQTNIFDYVVIQPHYYFDGTVQTNLDGVYNCVKKQNVCFSDGQPVITKKSKTAIGPEMELDWHIVPPSAYSAQLSRYLEYVAKYKEFKTTEPVVFYWDGNVQNALSGRINLYYKQ